MIRRQKIAFLALGMLLPVALLNAAKGSHSTHSQSTHKQQQKTGGMNKMNKKNVAPMATAKLSPAALAQTKMEAQTAIKTNNIAGLVDPVNTAPMQTARLLTPAMATQVLQQPGLTPQATAALQAVAGQTAGMSGAISMPAGMAQPGIAVAPTPAPTPVAPAAITPAPAIGPSMQGADIVVNPQVPVLGGIGGIDLNQ